MSKSYPNFTFNGIKSVDIGVYNVFVGETPTEILAASRNLITTKPFNRSSNVLSRIDLEPLTFTLQLSPLDGSFTPELIQKIYNWFDVDDYCKLYFADNRNFYYRCIPFVGNESDIELYIRNEGYFPVTFQCDAGHGYVDFVKELQFLESKTERVKIKNKNGIKIYGTYRVPLFLHSNFSGDSTDTLIIKNDDYIGQFETKTRNNNEKQIVVDAETGIVQCDVENSNPYALVSGVENLGFEGNKENTLKIIAKKQTFITLGASVPCMTGNKTADIDNFFKENKYVTDGLVMFCDGLTGLEDGNNRFCDIISERELETTTGEELINSRGGVQFDGDTHIETNTLTSSTNFTIEVLCRHIKVENTEQDIANTFEQSGFGLLNTSKKNRFAVWFGGNSGKYYVIDSLNESIVGKPYHLTGVVDGSKMYLYENDIKYEISTSGTMTHNKYGFGINIGKNCVTNAGEFEGWYSGNIYTVRLYNKALTEEEVMQNYKVDMERYGF